MIDHDFEVTARQLLCQTEAAICDERIYFLRCDHRVATGLRRAIRRCIYVHIMRASQEDHASWDAGST
jgi:hypothetical protein